MDKLKIMLADGIVNRENQPIPTYEYYGSVYSCIILKNIILFLFVEKLGTLFL
jgi:hypothetical protein